MQPLAIRTWGRNSQASVEARLPLYAVWPIATDAAYRSLALFGASPPEEVQVEVLAAYTSRDPQVAAALVCNVLGEDGQQVVFSAAYPVSSTECILGAAVDLRSSRAGPEEALSRFELAIPDPSAGYRMTVPMPVPRPARPLLEEGYAIGDALSQRPVVLFDGEAFEALENYYPVRTEAEAMAAIHGSVHYCPELALVWIHVTSFLPLEEEKAAASEVLVNPNALGPVIAAQRQSQFLGLVHNHVITEPDQLRTVLPSAVDVSTMRRVLYRAHQISVTVNVGAFARKGEDTPLAYYHLGWRRGNVIAAAGFVVHAPESIRGRTTNNATLLGEDAR